MPTNPKTLTLLTIPPEIRNAIYAYIFLPPVPDDVIQHQLPENERIDSPIAKALLENDDNPCDPSQKQPQTHQQATSNPTTTRLSPLLTCVQIHAEAHLLALSTTTFHLPSPLALPAHFTLATSALSPPQTRRPQTPHPHRAHHAPPRPERNLARPALRQRTPAPLDADARAAPTRRWRHRVGGSRGSGPVSYPGSCAGRDAESAGRCGGGAGRESGVFWERGLEACVSPFGAQGVEVGW
ncbi:hypothetical protein Q7P37_011619 [Cladosporium fusiforme]